MDGSDIIRGSEVERPLGRSSVMDKELIDRAEMIQERILQLRDSL
jgi:hypothetical protein